MAVSVKISEELLFTVEEFSGRLARVRSKMAERGLDVLLCPGPENIFYVSGYQSLGFQNYQMLIIPAEKEPVLVLRYLESFLAQKYSWIHSVVTYEDTDDPAEVTVNALREFGLLDRTVGIDESSFFFTVGDWRKLQAAIPHLVRGTGVVESCRAIKSPKEIQYMKEAARLTCLGMKAAIEEIHVGATENDLAAAAFDAMTRAGSEYLTDDPIITSGDRAGIPHTSYMRRRLEQGDTVLLEMSAVYNRYHAPLMRGAVLGEPSLEVRKMADICLEALDAALKAVRPGVTAGDVDEACRSVILRHGVWEGFHKRTGYSVGFGFGGWGEGHIISLKKGDPTVLVPGMCFHMPPALRDYGRAGLGFSETIVVTEGGAEILTDYPRQLAVR